MFLLRIRHVDSNRIGWIILFKAQLFHMQTEKATHTCVCGAKTDGIAFL